MGNCLVTKFKDSVDNSELYLYGEFRIHADSTNIADITEGMRTIYLNTGNGEVRTDGVLFTAPNGQSVSSYTGNGVFVFPEGKYDIHVLSKYTLTAIGVSDNRGYSSFFSFDSDELEYTSPSLFIAKFFAASGELHDISNDATIVSLNDYFSPTTNSAYVNFNIFEGKKYITTIEVYGRYSHNRSYGNLESICSPVLTKLLAYNTDVTGDINTMIQNMIAEGRQDGTYFTIQASRSYITVNGQSYEDFFNTLTGSGPTVKFTIDSNDPNGWTAIRVS